MSFTARYFGSCVECDARIQPGQEADYNLGGELVHVVCPESVDEPGQAVCGGCDLVHAGECF